jgi:hypothetical protein
MAEIIFKRPVDRLPPGRGYPLVRRPRAITNGTFVWADTPSHFDAGVEMVRRAICETEVEQMIGRGRGVRRTAANPLTVYVLTSHVLEMPVDGVCSLQDVWDDLAHEDPVSRLTELGVVPSDWKGRAQALAPMFDKSRNPAHACKRWFQNHPSAVARLASVIAGRGGQSGPNAGRNIVSANGPNASSAPWSKYRYRRFTERKSANVYVSLSVPDPRTAVEAVVGRLSAFS